jgi:hypothetical protein
MAHPVRAQLHRDCEWLARDQRVDEVAVECLRADVVVRRLKADALTWGSVLLVETDEAGAAYIAALEADGYNQEPLLAFARF